MWLIQNPAGFAQIQKLFLFLPLHIFCRVIVVILPRFSNQDVDEPSSQSQSLIAHIKLNPSVIFQLNLKNPQHIQFSRWEENNKATIETTNYIIYYSKMKNNVDVEPLLTSNTIDYELHPHSKNWQFIKRHAIIVIRYLLFIYK